MSEFKSDIHICTCPNQHLLSIGSACELCFGLVVDTAAEDKWPEKVIADPFDKLCFDELESYYEDIEYAS